MIPFDMVELTAEAQVDGETIFVSQSISEFVYQDGIARQAVEEALRYKLIASIMEKWKPKIRVRR